MLTSCWRQRAGREVPFQWLVLARRAEGARGKVRISREVSPTRNGGGSGGSLSRRRVRANRAKGPLQHSWRANDGTRTSGKGGGEVGGGGCAGGRCSRGSIAELSLTGTRGAELVSTAHGPAVVHQQDGAPYVVSEGQMAPCRCGLAFSGRGAGRPGRGGCRAGSFGEEQRPRLTGCGGRPSVSKRRRVPAAAPRDRSLQGRLRLGSRCSRSAGRAEAGRSCLRLEPRSFGCLRPRDACVNGAKGRCKLIILEGSHLRNSTPGSGHKSAATLAGRGRRRGVPGSLPCKRRGSCWTAREGRLLGPRKEEFGRWLQWRSGGRRLGSATSRGAHSKARVLPVSARVRSLRMVLGPLPCAGGLGHDRPPSAARKSCLRLPHRALTPAPLPRARLRSSVIAVTVPTALAPGLWWAVLRRPPRNSARPRCGPRHRLQLLVFLLVSAHQQAKAAPACPACRAASVTLPATLAPADGAAGRESASPPPRHLAGNGRRRRLVASIGISPWCDLVDCLVGRRRRAVAAGGGAVAADQARLVRL